MEVEKHSVGNDRVISSVILKAKSVYITFVNDEEMDIVELVIYFEHKDDEYLLSHFQIEEKDRRYYTDRTTIAADILDYLNNAIGDGEKCFSEKFEVTQELYDYVDNIIEEVLQKYSICSED